jgi:hypothetical protein
MIARGRRLRFAKCRALSAALLTASMLARCQRRRKHAFTE